MRKMIGTAAILASMFIVGCQSTKSESADACSHCPGVQKATADGTCPMCHGKNVAGKCTVCDAEKKM